jgi:hypothetical protein
MKLIKTTLPYLDQQTNAFIFLPEIGGENESVQSTFAFMAHGYTSDKTSIMNWAIRLAEVGVSCIVFDLPGHYQGNYSEVVDFEHFKNHAHELFSESFKSLKKFFLEEFPLYEHMWETNNAKLVFAGHSLGAMLSLKAICLPEFSSYEKRAVCVGLGMAPVGMVHLFDTPFYKSTLRVREQLVSPALKPDNVFPWIKEEKQLLTVSGQTIHLITGHDDLVVGEDGTERFMESLVQKNNTVTIERPTKLPHHEPNLAASHVKKYLKKINWF